MSEKEKKEDNSSKTTENSQSNQVQASRSDSEARQTINGRKLPEPLVQYFRQRREEILKIYPKAFDPNLTIEERMEMERAFAEAAEGRGCMSITAILQMTVFSILFMVVGVVLYREHNINIFYVILKFLHRLIDPGPAPNAAATAPATTAKPLQLTEAQRAGVVASTHGAQDLNVLESGSSVPVVPAQPTEDMPRISVKHEL